MLHWKSKSYKSIILYVVLQKPLKWLNMATVHSGLLCERTQRISANLKSLVNTLRLRQNCCHFADDIFKSIFLNENIWTSINISLKFVPKGQISNISALVQIMAWCRPGNKPLFEPMVVNLLKHICVTWLQWVKPAYHVTWNVYILKKIINL